MAVGFCPVGVCPSGILVQVGFCPFPVCLTTQYLKNGLHIVQRSSERGLQAAKGSAVRKISTVINKALIAGKKML